MADGLNRLRDPRFLAWRMPWLGVSLLLGALAIFGMILQAPVPDPFAPIGDTFFDWLRYPIEDNPQLRLPFTAAALHSIAYSADGQTALAVGRNGAILKSADGGDTWTQSTSQTSTTLNSVAIHSDGQTALAVGTSGTILKSVNGGDNWTQSSSGTLADLTSVAVYSDGQTALAVGTNGTILKSVNGGDTWTQSTSQTSTTLNSVAIHSDGQTALAVGTNGTILKSADSGDTWTQSTGGTSATLNSVAIHSDGQTVLAVGAAARLKSADGGDTWTQSTSGTLATLNSVAIHSDGQTVLAVGGSGTILKSADGGDTWTEPTSRTSTILNSIAIHSDGQTALAVGDGGTVLKSADGGDTWTEPTSGSSGFLKSVAIHSDGQTALTVGDSGTVLKSADGGNTWAARTSGTSERLFSVATQSDGQMALAVGTSGTILKTTDGGDTWMARTRTGQRLTSVAVHSDGQTALAVGPNGTILKSADGGDTWTQPTSPTTTSPTSEILRHLTSADIHSDGQTALAVGTGGTILKSVNGGDTWTESTSGSSAILTSVAIYNDGQTALAVGTSGTILKSVNGGDTWTVRISGTAQRLTSVAIHNDGQTALAVGDNGTIFRSVNGGNTWTQSTSGTLADLTSVAIHSDGQTALAVGTVVILHTSNKGETWRLLNAHDDYRKYPAPWTWFVLVLAILALLPAFQSPPPAPTVLTVGISDHLVSDRPVEAGDPDPLQRRSIADTLSRFLRNENTEPPMTIAITGNWGEGKSSLMNLVKAELEKHGTRSVWFNAWHHQKEQHLFASLLQAVRDQAIPPAWTLGGLQFRLRLAASRACHHWLWVIVALLLAGFSVGALWANPSAIIPSICQTKNWYWSTSPLISLLLTLLIAYRSLSATLKRSGVNPGRLLAAASGAFRVKAFGNRLGFRHQFGEAFKEVAEALQPNTLLILIDDLDRCRPEQVVEILEAINFLVSAGPCYVVMGIAPEQVMYCVGLGFKEIAAEMAKAPDGSPNLRVQARDARRDFARNYLEKLINIEVPVPRLTDADAGKLAKPVRSSTGPSEVHRALWHFVSKLAAFAGVLTVLGAGIYVGPEISEMYRNATTSSERPITVPPSRPPEPSPALDPAPTPEPNGDGNGNFRPGAEERVPWWVPLLAGLLGFAIVVAVAVYAWRRQEDHIQDSPAFTDALNIWHPLVRARTNSPRQMKRFINRVRYLAMTPQQGRNQDSLRFSEGVERLKFNMPPPLTTIILNRIRGWFGVTAAPEDKAQQELSESLIVALAALQGVNRDTEAGNEAQPPLDVARLLTIGNQDNAAKVIINDWLGTMLERQEKEQIRGTIHRAVASHSKAFSDEIVTPEILSRFHKMASGIVVR